MHRHRDKMVIGDDPSAKEPGWCTGVIHPFSRSAAVPTDAISQWSSYRITCIGQTFTVGINGRPVNRRADPQQCIPHGYPSLHHPGGNASLRPRNLRIKELP